MKRYDFGALKDFAAAVLTAADSHPGEALVVADNLTSANLRGIDSHGIVRLPIYERRLTQGQISSPCDMRVLRETSATALLDGANGWGAVVGVAGMELAITKARDSGVGVVSVVNSNHFGYAAYYGEMALAEDMIGMVFTNANALVIPFGGTMPFMGTNPICICIPAGTEPPFVFDAATTVVARGKISVAVKRKTKIPLDWGVDKNGVPTDDPEKVAYLSPLGGYKGSDLAIAIDILSGILGGGPFGPMIGVLERPERPQQIGHLLMALRIDAFRDPAEFKRDLDEMCRQLRAQPPAPGADGVQIAGDPERRQMAERSADGIPVPVEIEADLMRLAERYDLIPLKPLQAD